VGEHGSCAHFVFERQDPFRQLVEMTCNTFCNLCMITKLMNKWMLNFVNAIVSLIHCIYLMQSLHHNLLDFCKYLMMQRSLWHMVHTSSSEDPILNIPEGSARHGCGQAPHGNAPPPSPHALVGLQQLLELRMTLCTSSRRMRHVVWLNVRNLDTKTGIPHIWISWSHTCLSSPMPDN
jgi:hypothetical protein